MPISHMAVIVSMDGFPSDKERAREQVWGTVSNLLLPALGKLYERFYPAAAAWGEKINEPYSVILGNTRPDLFLLFFAKANIVQSRSIAYHIDELVRTVYPYQFIETQGSIVCPVVVDGSNQEQMSHAIWHLSLHRGAPLPDCGIYYTSLGRALATDEEERAVLGNPSGYALCVVTLEAVEGSNG